MTISIINYGCGNIGSIVNMLKHIGVEAEVISEAEQINKARKIILPGVGKWDSGVQYLRESGILSALEQRVLSDRIPILGICLGMQLLLDSSEEGSLPGLGWIEGTVRAFDFSQMDLGSKRLAVPHMGWNTVTVTHDCMLTESLGERSKFYFVHSYYADLECSENILLQSQYGHTFTSAVRKENIYGLQFHPEKSHRHGMNIMKSFASV
ncbi:MAG TPA: imidazole glycerol phosphate synthase subunit HisH [Betaproteobacteria bacterium]|jgi:glutamine amidotransferase|nr:imidazole glycerol phosphate synthase subunit HisH [Porticoccaceae bacterium]HAT53547.1 imidazole glycerol phosphate synthase subunit HisH [Betaproteobacteria bacterium]